MALVSFGFDFFDVREIAYVGVSINCFKRSRIVFWPLKY